jgi:hypothetical protein
MQENLAINGVIIHIYRNKETFRKYHTKNKKVIYDEFSPTKFYESYYWDHDSILKPARTIRLGNESGMNIQYRNYESLLEEYFEIDATYENVLGLDNNSIDTIKLLQFLNRVSEHEDPFNFLLDSNPLPQFLNLCRWSSDQANCKVLETAIIENDQIKICWYSDPIAKVGDSFERIKENVKKLQDEVIIKRNCEGCIKRDDCTKCYFSYPLTSEQFCEFKINSKSEDSIALINSCAILNDLVFTPVNFFM